MQWSWTFARNRLLSIVRLENSVSIQCPRTREVEGTNSPRSCWQRRDNITQSRETVAIGGLKREGTPVAAYFFRGQSRPRRCSGCAPVVAVMETGRKCFLRRDRSARISTWRAARERKTEKSVVRNGDKALHIGLASHSWTSGQPPMIQREVSERDRSEELIVKGLFGRAAEI